jgi:hypothetical protein
MVDMTTVEHRQRADRVDDRAGLLLGFVAGTVAAASAVHLAGYTPSGTSPPFDAEHAGIAEALIAVVVAAGAIAVLRAGRHGRAAALAANTFAIVGFGVGLSFTVRGGDVPDVVYHVVMLPVLVATWVHLLRLPPPQLDPD